MIGRTPGNVRAIRPMRDGVIADYLITEAMLRYVINKVARVRIFKPDVMISVPSGVTSVEKRAVRDAALKAGAREASLAAAVHVHDVDERALRPRSGKRDPQPSR